MYIYIYIYIIFYTYQSLLYILYILYSFIVTCTIFSFAISFYQTLTSYFLQLSLEPHKRHRKTNRYNYLINLKMK